jgi:hypothetical protein
LRVSSNQVRSQTVVGVQQPFALGLGALPKLVGVHVRAPLRAVLDLGASRRA